VPYWARPDLGIGPGDISVQQGKILVTVHSLGAIASPTAELALVDREGKVISSVSVPPLKAPADLLPKTFTVGLVRGGSKLDGASVVIDPNAKIKEITRMNNRLRL